jgi:DNA (cytosine-5)-methyltransferase 1
MRLGSLCSGAGGLDMAVEEVFGATTAWHCEINDAATKVLEYRYPGVPNHRDLTETDWDAVERVDILTGGYPCQPFSHAGQRKGTDDERHIWPAVREAIRRVRPRLTLLENVAGHRSLGFDRVLGDLAEDGMHVRWTSVRASDVGAPHQRERLFILIADSRDGYESEWPRAQGWEGGQRSSVGSLAGCGGGDALDLLPTPCAHQSGNTPENHLRKKPGRHVVTDLAILVENGLLETGGALLPTPTTQDGSNCAGPSQFDRNSMPLNVVATLLPTPGAADGSGGRSPRHSGGQRPSGAKRSVPLTDLPLLMPGAKWGKYEAAIQRWEHIIGPAPSPTEPSRNGKPRLNPAFSEWMMGWPAGWVTAVPSISRNDQLRIIGNGVVPQCAAAALRWLLSLEVAA